MKLATLSIAIFATFVAAESQSAANPAVTLQDHLFHVAKDLVKVPVIAEAIQADATLSQLATTALKQQVHHNKGVVLKPDVGVTLQLLNSLAQAVGLITTTTAATTTLDSGSSFDC